MTYHATFAPSSASTWLHCSWSALNAPAQEVKPQSTIEKAAEGTRVHALLETWHASGAIPNDEDDFRVVNMWRNFIAKLEPGRQHAEKRVVLNDHCWGTVDFENEHPQVVTVMDFKNGVWDVAAHHNLQMLTYAAMELPHMSAEYWRFVIFQPNTSDDDDSGDAFKQWVAHRSEVEAHRARVLAVLATAGQTGPKPGPHCRWCKAFQTCPAMSTDAGFIVGAMARPIESLTPDEILRMLRLIRALGDVKAVYADALATHLKLGRQVDGAALEPKRSWRAWNDEQQAAAHLFSQFGWKAVKPVSPKQAEGLGPAGKVYAKVGAHKPPGELTVKY